MPRVVRDKSDHGEVPIGTLIAGRYRVESVLGVGGMGVVVGAYDVRGGERVAVKLLSPDAARDSAAASRILREAQAAERMTGEHAVRVLSSGRTPDGTPFLAMEFLEGTDLARLLVAEGSLP